MWVENEDYSWISWKKKSTRKGIAIQPVEVTGMEGNEMAVNLSWSCLERGEAVKTGKDWGTS